MPRARAGDQPIDKLDVPDLRIKFHIAHNLLFQTAWNPLFCFFGCLASLSRPAGYMVKTKDEF
jgi:hypothetical protein